MSHGVKNTNQSRSCFRFANIPLDSLFCCNIFVIQILLFFTINKRKPKANLLVFRKSLFKFVNKRMKKKLKEHKLIQTEKNQT